MMTVEFLCDTCGTKLRTPDGSSGKKTKCPKCETILTIPEPPAVPQAPGVSPSQASGLGAGEWSGFERPQRSVPLDFHETGNPWQAPPDIAEETVPKFGYSSTGVTGDRLGFTQAFSMTYETLKSNFLPFFILGIIVIGVQAVNFVIGVIVQSAVQIAVQSGTLDPVAGMLFLQSCNFATSVVSGLVGLGISLCALELIRTGSTSLGTGLRILPKIVSVIAFWFLGLLLVLCVIGVPVGGIALLGWLIETISGNNGLGVVVGFCLGIPWVVIASIVVTYRFVMYGPLLIVDQNVSAFQAFSLSWAITKGNALTLLCIFLVFTIGATIVVCCTLLLGIFVIAPFALCLTAMCYHIMWEQYSAKTAQQEVTEW